MAEQQDVSFADRSEGDEAAPLTSENRTLKSRLRLPLLLAVPAIVLIAALAFYLHGGRYESTDNSYVQAGLVSITPNVSGHVISVEVKENQFVRAGQILFRIDPAHYLSAVRGADAQLADARSKVAASQADYTAAQARVKAAQAQLDYAQSEAARQKNLLAQGISSQDQYDQAVLAVKTANQAIASAQGEAESIKAALSGMIDAPVTDQPHSAPAETPRQASASPPAPASRPVEIVNSLFGPVPGRLPRRRTSG